ncbi:hypothetical protein L208DRAFT_1249877, partial [Tricholoma matsutake]
VCHYQDSKDCAGTSNLKAHTMKCFGEDAVDATFKKTSSIAPDGSIFTLFAQLDQETVSISHCAHTTDETWSIFCHQHLEAGHPGTSLPSLMMVAREVKILFDKCHSRIDKILKEHLGCVHFAMDAWTSPNHC